MPSARVAAGFSVATLALVALLALPRAADAAPERGSTVVGSGVSKTETRNVSGFRGIALGVHARLEIRQGASEALSITGDDNILPLVETVVESGVLKIRWKHEGDYSTRYQDLAVVVDVRNLDAITLGGSGRIHAKALKTASLAARIGGSGDIVIDSLEADSATATVSGSGHFTAAGRAETVQATLAGSGQLSAGKLEARHARTTLQGSAKATVWARDTLNATIAGSGEVEYYGRPSVRQTIAGSGSVTHLADSP
jgi:hypothetical protein